MYITQRQEQFSSAYLRAVASVAGYSLSKPDVDDDSIDFSLSGRGRDGTVCSPRLDLQLKCWMSDAPVEAGGIHYPLKTKNYDDLRITNVLVPRILVIVVVPKEISGWLHQSDDETLVKYCGYWTSLRGKPATANTSSITVHLPQVNRLTPDALTMLMQTIEAGGTP